MSNRLITTTAPANGLPRQPARDDSPAGEPSLAELIDAFMRRERLTLAQMSARAGVSIATVAALRAGTRGKRPHPDTLAKLAEAMATDVAALERVVASGSGPERLREVRLLERFRALDDEGKVRVERLAAALRRGVRSGRRHPTW